MVRKSIFVAGIIVALALCSCVPPVRLTKQLETIPGAPMKSDPASIRPAITTRAQVESSYKTLDTNATPGMFWGRYNESTWSDPGGSRAWHRTNLIVTFDADGIVKTSRRVGDEQLNPILLDWLAANSPKYSFDPPLRLQAKVERNNQRFEAEVLLEPDKMTVVERGEKPFTWTIPAAKITRMEASWAELCCVPEQRAVSEIEEKIWSDTRESGGHALRLQLSPSDVLVLLDYVREKSSSARIK